MGNNDIKKALECCASPTQMCKDCPMPEEVKDDCRCMETISRNALSLIKELTEERKDFEIRALREENEAAKYKDRYETEKQAHEMLSESYDHLEKTKDELLSERARITEENARLEKLCALRDQDNKDTQDLLYKAEAENDRLMRDKTALECIVETARNQAKADTVRKMQERLTERLNRNSIFKGITMSAGETVYDVIDQIAKELTEGKDENT